MTAMRCDTQSFVLSDCISSMHEYVENVFRVVQNLKFPDHRLESAPPSTIHSNTTTVGRGSRTTNML